ncbi:unnamed protein product [Rotaria sp. Silwood2]|nr:unnamed protein product [Rotaria sp. Silwood2]
MDDAVHSIISVTKIQQRRPIVQNYSLLWIDGTIDKSEANFQKDFDQIKSVISDVNVFTHPDDCIQLLNTMTLEKGFLIVSGFLGQYFVPQIHSMRQVDTIYIYCSNKARHEQWAHEWPKIEGVHISIKTICESLNKVTRQCDHDAISMSFVANSTSSTTSTTNEDKSLDQLEPSYMYTMLFKDIILQISEDDDKPVEYFVAYCRSKGISESELTYFQSKYHEHSAVWWYTCEIFLYSMLNRALRTLDMEVMTRTDFFIRNLHRQLQQLQEEHSSAFEKKFIIYRGQGLSPEDFQHLQDTKGGLLAFNCFLSTSTEKDVSMEFIKGNLCKYEQNVGVLFIMTIDQSKISSSSTPFALIDKYSAIPTENEVLFSMHTVFRLGEMEQSTKDKRLWEVQLTITDDNDPQLADLVTYMKKEIDGSGWYRMGKLMLTLEKFDDAELLYNQLLEVTSNDSDRAYIYHQLGRVKKDQGKYKEAVTFYEKSLEIYLKAPTQDNPSLASAYNNIGQVYDKMGEYSKALEFYEKSHKIKEKALPSTHPDLATSYNNIGQVYNNMGEYWKALQFYEKSNEIFEKSLPPTHPDLAACYNNIGQLYSNVGENSKALEFYEKSHQILEKSLPASHPNLASSCNNIAAVYYQMDQYSKALEFYEQSLEIMKKSLPSNHPDLAVCYNNMGLVYNEMGDYSKALSFYEQSIEIKKKTFPPNHPDLSASYNNIGLVYNNTGEYSRALEFLEKAQQIWMISLPPGHTHIALIKSNIEHVKKKM